MIRSALATLASFLVPVVALAEEAVVGMASERDGTPAEMPTDPTLAFALAAVGLVVALYAVHRLVHRKVR